MRVKNRADWPGGGFLKSLKMTGVGMPQFYERDIATGELAQVTGVTLVTVFSESLYMKNDL
jgi:hypothetical protein